MTRRSLLAIVALMTACSAQSVGPEDDLASIIEAAEPGAVVELAAGRHEGPFVIAKPLTIVGGGGSILEATDDSPVLIIEDTTDVTLRDLYLAGGESGIVVRRAERVEIEDVVIEQALWHGIHAQDSEIHVRDCHISGLRAGMPQGIEIINSDGRPDSSVRGCTVEGPVFEGIVAHVSHVVFEDNEVIGATERGIVITEMSDGVMEGNSVSDSRGSAYFCGDMSSCAVVDNEASAISPGKGHASGMGHGVVVHFHSHAFVEGVEAMDVTGERVKLMVGSELLEETPYP